MADSVRTDATLAVPAVERRRSRVWGQNLNWRLVLVRLVTSGLAVTVTVVFTPGLSFSGWRPGQFWLVAGVFALISAVVKPALQFFSLRFLVASYGLINIVVNAVLLWLLTVVLSDLITYDCPVAADPRGFTGRRAQHGLRLDGRHEPSRAGQQRYRQ